MSMMTNILSLMHLSEFLGAMEELRLAGVGVMENQYLMPLKQTRNALADAQKLLDKKQYYEANLALKGAEDGIIVDSEALFVN